MTKPQYPPRTIYISGTWDLFHKGHKDILEQANMMGRFLVVGVNTAEYARLIGKKPVMSFQERLSVLSALWCVNALIPHDSADDMSGIDIYGATVRVVGPDWATLPDRHLALREMKTRKVKIVQLPRTPGISTSIIKERIKNLT